MQWHQFPKHYNAKHSPPGHKFQKSEGPHASGLRPAEIMRSTLIQGTSFRNQTVLPQVGPPKFWTRSLISGIRHDFNEILRILSNLSSWNQVLWNLVVSDIIPDDPKCLYNSPNMSWFIFTKICFHNFKRFLLFSNEENVSHPLSSTGWVPQV